jgi:hypothetical protein
MTDAMNDDDFNAETAVRAYLSRLPAGRERQHCHLCGERYLLENLGMPRGYLLRLRRVAPESRHWRIGVRLPGVHAIQARLVKRREGEGFERRLHP